MKKVPKALVARISRIRLVILDVDGVLTDGRLYYGADGEALKVFNTLDGHGMKMLAESGVALAIISGRASKALQQRAKDLDVSHVMMGVGDKAVAYRALLKKCKLAQGAVASIGDDVPDLPILLHCGFSAAVPAAPDEVKSRVDLVTTHAGGQGAVREFCEIIMRAQGTLDAVMQKYLD